MKYTFPTPKRNNNRFSNFDHTMNFSRVQIILISLVFIFLIFRVDAQNSTENDAQVLQHFHPSIAAITGVIGIMFSIVVLVVAYAKFCHQSPFNLLNPQDIEFQGAQPSGIDKSVIDKIPIFRFSSLRGSKRGLECAVCLSAYEDIEILKLLPKCKHAFHRNCIDEWLESHSSCPLCRQRFDAVDVSTFAFSNSLRFFQTPSNLTDDPGLELFIQRDQQDEAGPSRFNIGGSFRHKFKLRDAAREQKALLHKVKHRIIVSAVVVKHRWSDLNSSDLLSLNSDMLNESSSQRFTSLGSRSARFSGSWFPKSTTDDDVLKIKDELIEKKRIIMNESKFSMMQRSTSVSTFDTELIHQGRMLHQNANRSMSEIMNVSRFRDFTSRNKAKESPSNAKEERRRRLWLLIARRTLQWFAGFEKTQPRPDHHNLLPSNV